MLDRDASDCVRVIEETGMLDDVHKQALQETLRRYVETIAPAPLPDKAGKTASQP
jgi:hypothetical protein